MSKNISLALIILFCIGSCLPNNYGPDIVSKKVNKSTGYSNDQVRTIFVDQPFLASGDYFLKSTTAAQAAAQNQQAVNRGNRWTGNTNNSPQQNIQYPGNNYSSRTVSPGQQTTQNAMNQAGYGRLNGQDGRDGIESKTLKIKIGILPDSDLEGSYAMDALCSQADLFFRIRPEALLIPRIQIYHSFGQNQDTLSSIVLRKSKIPANFSGLRNLLYVNTLEVPKHFPGTAYFGMKIFDFGLRDGFTMPVFKSTVRNRTDLNNFWRIVLARVWNQVWQNDQILPWFTRVVYQNQDVICIDAGINSGLKKGQILKVMKKGKIIKSREGVAIGWLPGELKGELEVTGFTGVDKAFAQPSSGFVIDRDDFIILKQKYRLSDN